MLNVISENNIHEINTISNLILIVPVYSYPNTHYINNELSAICIYDIPLNKRYEMSFTNRDIKTVPKSTIKLLLDGRTVLSYNSKLLTYKYPEYKIIDLNHFIWFFTNKTLQVNDILYPLIQMYSGFHNTLDYIPIVNVIEHAQAAIDKVRELYDFDRLYDMIRVYDPIIHAFQSIEKNSITINKDSEYCNINDDHIYNDFNFCTTTGRPTSTYLGTNLMSLRKDSTREIITHSFENGKLFEFDYINYHPSILAELIGYEYTEDTIYQQIANDLDLHVTEYEEVKKHVFSVLYGSSSEKLDHPFFNMVEVYKSKLYEDYLNQELLDPSGKRYIHEKLYEGADMNPSKLLSYYIQMYETFLNSQVIQKIQDYLYKNFKQSKIILYVYDSILFDYHPNDGIETIKNVIEIMESFNHKVSIKSGINYKDLVTIKLNFGND